MIEKSRVQFKLMLPADLKVALEEAAHGNRRSLSAEIIERLSESIRASASRNTVPEAEIDAIVERVVRRVLEDDRRQLDNDR